MKLQIVINLSFEAQLLKIKKGCVSHTPLNPKF